MWDLSRLSRSLKRPRYRASFLVGVQLLAVADAKTFSGTVSCADQALTVTVA